MSWTETNPKITTTEIIERPLQVLYGLPDAQMRNFGNLPQSFLRPIHGTKVPPLQFSDIPLKERFVETVEWKVGEAPGVIWTKEIDPEFLISFMEKGSNTFMWYDISGVEFKIRANANAAYQGMMWLVWEPTPIANYALAAYGITVSQYQKSQLQRLEITPNSSGAFSFTVPIIYPFDMFLNTGVSDPNEYYSTLTDYLKKYSFGRIYLQVVVGLETANASIISLNYPLSLSIKGVNYAGTNYSI